MSHFKLLFAVLYIIAAAHPLTSTNGQEKPRVTAEQLILPGEILDVDGKTGFISG